MNKQDKHTSFHPQTVDKQIDAYLAGRSANGQESDRYAQASVHDVQAYFAPPEQDEALQRVWQRFAAQRTNLQRLQAGQQTPQVLPITGRGKSTQQKNTRPLGRVLSVMAAVIVVALLIGSTMFLFQQARQTGNPAGQGHHQTAMFVRVNQTLYRLDMQTHRPLWQFQAPPGQPGLATFNGPYIAGMAIDSTYYAWGFDGQQVVLYALDIANGKLRWQHDTYGIGPIAASGNMVALPFIKGTNLEVTALDIIHGTSRWEHILGPAARTKTLPSTVSLFGASDTAVYGAVNTPENHSGLRFALSVQDGQFIWQQKEVYDASISYATLDQGFLSDDILCVIQHLNWQNPGHIPESKSVILGYDAHSGKQLWKSSSIDWATTTTLVDGVLYLETPPNSVGTPYKSIYAVSSRDGSLRWQYQEPIQNPYPFITKEGVYFIQDGGKQAGSTLVVLDPATGKPRWTYAFHDSGTVEFPPVADDNQVYLSLPGNIIQILRASDGKPLGSFKIDPQNVKPNNRILLQIVEL
ncbi:PQQ-binding-like beta-propeller repeat protein [Ktedonobacter robiniae]|uniref:Pyrrolo-quinoline quinone repeat domain-containing protein n=1 Tax=Ktedonobacter robiniae TaxID=2778365 RepID=A0ABQ3UHB6_9CHLR|nr:PQQ-binding-like beta-propeller repeat protein [Ktedonobacter robiniae]GHO52068.1 hypothetical protein KSB_05430 [Ktedonobacter robiniae]